MKKVIRRFELCVAGRVEAILPKGAEILSVQFRLGSLFIWALVDLSTEAELEKRVFRIFELGNIIDDNSVTNKYIGTFHLYGGASVFHLFEES